MARKRHSDEDCLRILRQVELDLAAGVDVAKTCRTAGISDAAYYTWRKKFGRLARPQLRELTALEKENQRLKKMDVLEALYPLLLNRGKPEYIRSDDGPEFTSEPFKDWLTKISIKPINIYPGSPWDETVKKSLQLERFQVERIQ